MHLELIVLFLLVAVAALTVAAQRLGVPYPMRDVLDARRRQLIELRNDGDISDHVLYNIMRELDLEDQRLEA